MQGQTTQDGRRLYVWHPLDHARADLDITHDLYQQGKLGIGDLIYQAEKVGGLELKQAASAQKQNAGGGIAS